MTPVPRGLVRVLGALALLAAVPALPAAAAGREMPTCNGVEATIVAVPGVVTRGTPGNDVIVGTDGDDYIRAGAGDDLICGGEGNDIILAGPGNDIVYGGPGNDIILAGAGNDIVYGGEGNDIIFGGRGHDTLYGEAGVDEIYGEAGRDTLYGGDHRDVLVGGPGNDTLYGGGGNDTLYGEEGRDRLFGEAGDDELQGGPGDDRLFGGPGNDYLWGDEGDDLLVGGAGDDLLQGGEGADVLKGQGGFDEMWGGECGGLSSPMRCRRVPSGRPPPSPAIPAEPGDVYVGGPGIDACNRSATVPAGCETYRGSRGPGGDKATSREWWGHIVRAFDERALLLVDAGKVAVADALLAEVEHAKQIVSCESLGDPFQMTPSPPPVGTTVDGLFQHKSIYWAGRASGAGYPGASIFDPLANARVAAWMVAEDIEAGRDPWIDWACDEVLKKLGVWE